MGTSSARGVRVKVAASIGLAAFIAMGSLAAASPTLSTTDKPTPDKPTITPAPTDPVAKSPDQATDEPAPEVVDGSQTDAPEPSDDTDTIAVPSDEPSGVCLTHGQRVSAVAHSTPPGPAHGAAVSAAAHDRDGECAHGGDTESRDEPPSEPAHVVQPTAAAQPAPAGPVVVEHGGPDRSTGQAGHGHGNSGGHGKG